MSGPHRPSPLAVDDPASIARLRDVLDRAPFTGEAIRDALGTAEDVLSRARDIPVHERRLRQRGAFGALVRLFVLNQAVPRGEAAAALAPFPLDAAVGLRIVRLEGDLARPLVRLVPHDDLMMGLLTAPFSTASLTLNVAEIRNAVAQDFIASAMSASADDDPPKPPVFDIVAFHASGLQLTPEDFTRHGKRVGQIVVDPNAPPTSVEIDLTDVVPAGGLDPLGIRIQLHGVEVPEADHAPDGGRARSSSEDDAPKNVSASFSAGLVFVSA